MFENEDQSFSAGNDDGFDLDPNDFFSDDTQPEDQEEYNEFEQDPNNTNVDDQLSNQEMLKVRFNHEDMEIPMSEATNLIQMGLNYDKIHSRLQEFENHPALSFVSKLSEQQGMSVEEFIQEFEQEQLNAKVERLMQNNIPKEYAEEMIRNAQFREQYEAQQQQMQQEQEEQQQYMEFFHQFKKIHGRDFVAGKDDPSPEVWSMVEQGIPLKYAYLESQVAEMQNKLKQYEHNRQNSRRSPVGSTTNFGSTDPSGRDPFLEGFESYG